MNGFFYNSAIKNYLNVVSVLFSDIYVMRNTGSDTYMNRVPVNMIDATKVVKQRNHINSRTTQYDIAKVADIFPKINIKLIDGVPASLMAVGSTVFVNRFGEKQYSPAPMNMLFEVNIMTKSLNDMTMIYEQIIPYFRPHFTIQIREMVNGKIINERDVQLVYQVTSKNNDTLGSHEQGDIYEWSMIFEMIGYIYPPQISRKDEDNIIHYVILNFKGDEISFSNFDELITDFEEVEIEAKDKSIETREEFIEKGSETIITRKTHVGVPDES